MSNCTVLYCRLYCLILCIKHSRYLDWRDYLSSLYEIPQRSTITTGTNSGLFKYEVTQKLSLRPDMKVNLGYLWINFCTSFEDRFLDSANLATSTKIFLNRFRLVKLAKYHNLKNTAAENYVPLGSSCFPSSELGDFLS